VAGNMESKTSKRFSLPFAFVSGESFFQEPFRFFGFIERIQFIILKTFPAVFSLSLQVSTISEICEEINKVTASDHSFSTIFKVPRSFV